MSITRGMKSKFSQDVDAESPREGGDYLGQMLCFHSKYNLGDGKLTLDQVKQLVQRKGIISLPLYLCDHSGITMSTTPFSYRWDGGQVGWIYTNKEKAKEWLGIKRITSKQLSKIERILKYEVEEYDQYLTGDIYGFKITKGEEKFDVGWNYYGEDNTIRAAKEVIDACTK